MIELSEDQRSVEWWQARAGMVTGTSLGRAVGTPAVQQTYMYELIASMMTTPIYDDFSTAAMARGRDMEPFALAALGKQLELNFETCGFLKSEIIKGFGLSPDAVSRNEKKIIVGGAEVKCPDTKTHIKYILKNEIPKEYWHQTIAPFVASDDVKWWYFASYDDRCYERPLFIKTIDRPDVEVEVQDIRRRLNLFLQAAGKQHETLTF